VGDAGVHPEGYLAPPILFCAGGPDLLSRLSDTVLERPKSKGRSCPVFWAWRISGWRGRSIGRGKLVVPKVPRLSFVRHRQSGLPKRTIASGKLCAANSVSFNRVFLQRSAVGRRDQALRRQNAGGRAACNSSRSDKFRDRCFGVVL
jgi:hypothetical protein